MNFRVGERSASGLVAGPDPDTPGARGFVGHGDGSAQEGAAHGARRANALVGHVVDEALDEETIALGFPACSDLERAVGGLQAVETARQGPRPRGRRAVRSCWGKLAGRQAD